MDIFVNCTQLLLNKNCTDMATKFCTGEGDFIFTRRPMGHYVDPHQPMGDVCSVLKPLVIGLGVKVFLLIAYIVHLKCCQRRTPEISAPVLVNEFGNNELDSSQKQVQKNFRIQGTVQIVQRINSDGVGNELDGGNKKVQENVRTEGTVQVVQRINSDGVGNELDGGNKKVQENVRTEGTVQVVQRINSDGVGNELDGGNKKVQENVRTEGTVQVVQRINSDGIDQPETSIQYQNTNPQENISVDQYLENETIGRTKLYRVNSLTPDKLKDIYNAASRGGIRKPKRNYLSRTNLSRNNLSRNDLSRNDLSRNDLSRTSNLEQVAEEETIDL